MTRGMLRSDWITAIVEAADQLVECKAISALTDSKLRFQSHNGEAFTATCDSCKNPACCQRRGPCEHRMAATVWARYREEERKRLPASEILYNSQIQMNKNCSVTLTCENQVITVTARQFATFCVFYELNVSAAESVNATEILLESQIGFHETDE